MRESLMDSQEPAQKKKLLNQDIIVKQEILKSF